MTAVGLGSGILSKQSALTVHLLTLPSQEPCSPHTRKDPGKSEVPRPLPLHTPAQVYKSERYFIRLPRGSRWLLTVTQDIFALRSEGFLGNQVRISGLVG